MMGMEVLEDIMVVQENLREANHRTIYLQVCPNWVVQWLGVTVFLLMAVLMAIEDLVVIDLRCIEQKGKKEINAASTDRIPYHFQYQLNKSKMCPCKTKILKMLQKSYILFEHCSLPFLQKGLLQKTVCKKAKKYLLC